MKGGCLSLNFYYDQGSIAPLMPADLLKKVNAGNPFMPFGITDVDNSQTLQGTRCKCHGNGEFEDLGLKPGTFRHRFRCRVCGEEVVF